MSTMDPQSPQKVISPALTPVSLDRMNQQRLPSAMPEYIHESKHHRSSSDVQSKVAFLNSLSRTNERTSQQYGGTTTAALQRAIIGREEAEAALYTLREEMSEAQVRERKISERLESLMEELQSTKERQAHERQVYEKEIKKARKDAFRAGSALVKLQEDLKEARSENRNLKAVIQKERFEKEKSKQEAFERAYTLAGLTEEMHAMKEKMRSIESDRETEFLNQQADELQIDQGQTMNSEPTEKKAPNLELESQQDLAQQQAQQEAQYASDSPSESSTRKNRFERPLLSVPQESDAIVAFGDPLKPRRITFFKSSLEDEEAEEADLQERFEALKAELMWERRCKAEAEDMIHFLNMECQFKTCACRRAEAQGKKFVHDWDYENKLRAESAERKRSEEPEEVATVQENHEVKLEEDKETVSAEIVDQIKQEEEVPEQVPEQELEQVAEPVHQNEEPEPVPTQDLFDINTPEQPVVPEEPQALPEQAIEEPPAPTSPVHQEPPVGSTTPTAERTAADISPVTTPARPLNAMLHAQTTTITMKIPLRDHEAPFAQMPGTPGTPATLPGTPISREQALAQIRARRDRARSISLKSKDGKTPGSARRLVGGRVVRDISAPGRF